ncbi:hypothetical protein [Okeania sp. KiyG1]|nr:hypothetical protein [Okeania sp. KiyG1]
MKTLVLFHASRDGWKNLIREKQPFLGASRDENIFGIAPGKKMD